MSSYQYLGPHGTRLLKQFEKGPDKRKINGVWVPWPRSPGGAALKAYPCSARKQTISWGCTTWFDGRPVREDDTLESEAQAEELLQINLKPFALLVDRLVTVDITANQRDALICLAFNVGSKAFAEPCTALRQTNNGNFELAAEGFGLFTGVTTYSPTQKQVADPEYAGAIGSQDGKWIWVGPQKQPCGYMTRLDGLLRRHHSEGLLYKGFNWETACAEGKVDITLRPPSQRLWNARGNRWEDRIHKQTSISDLESVAERYPLDSTELVLFDARPIDFTPDVSMPEDDVEFIPVEASTSPTENVEAAPPGPVVGAQPLPAQGPAHNTNPQPASVTVVPQAGSGGEAGKAVGPVSSPPQPQQKPTVRPPLALPPARPTTVDVNALNLNNIKAENGAKPMETSDRAMAVAVKAAGWLLKVQARRATAWAPAADAYFQFMGDPVLAAAVIGGGGWVLGEGIVKVGNWMREKFNKTASTLTY